MCICVYVVYIYILSVMEDDTSSAVTKPRLYGIVHTYMQKHLPRNIHPAFKALRDREEESLLSPQIDSTGVATLPALAIQDETYGIDQVGRDQDDDGDDQISL